MPWLTLSTDTRLEDEWRVRYVARLADAQSIAARMPLMHVSGKAFPFEQLFSCDPPEIPTSAKAHAYCSDWARTAEDALKLKRSVYFYAGHAWPEFGNVALAFRPEVEQGHDGSATPFDTGGWVAEPPYGHIKSKLRGGTPEDRYEYAMRVTVPLKEWRTRFAEYLAAYFDPYEAYWSGGPNRMDPEEIYDAANGNDARAWIVEVRFEEPQPLSDVAAWCASPRAMVELQRAALLSSSTGHREARLLRHFLRLNPPLRQRGDHDYHGILMAWAKQECGL